MSSAPQSSAEAIARAARGVGARGWHLGWAAAQAALAGLALLVAGAGGVRIAAALALASIPGVLGGGLGSDPASRRTTTGMLAAWTLAAAAAVTVAGGASAPLGVYALAPGVAAILFRARWTTAVALAAATAAFVAVMQLGRRAELFDPVVLAATAGGALVIVTVAAAVALTARSAAPKAVTAPHDWLERVSAAEAGRAEAEAEAAARARVLANMSHELRTPLNAVMGFSDIMRTRLFGPLPERYAEYAELIHESGRHLVDLINDVLDLSKIDADRYELRRELFDAREAVNAALRLIRGQADEAGVQLRGVLPAEVLEIDADRRAIKQIVLNLLSNAIKFTPPGGRASVALTRIGATDIDLLVTDTGAGIAAEDIPRLGRPFEQTDAGRAVRGSGLGLSLVRGFARLHGGEMIVESRLGEGTAVSVRLPVAVAPSALAAAAAEAHR